MDGDKIFFGITVLAMLLAAWTGLCFNSIRQWRLSIAELLALVFSFALAFGLASWL